jgi:hypothetical protein
MTAPLQSIRVTIATVIVRDSCHQFTRRQHSKTTTKYPLLTTSDTFLHHHLAATLARTKIIAFALAAAFTLPTSPLRAEDVGNVGAVNVLAHGTPPGAAKHELSVGLGVQERERIETSAEGSAQIIFRDRSTIAVGRNSVVTIDDFVFNGAGGSQGVSMAKGLMRFVGGDVSHGSGAHVRTPTASIGVRGGMAMIGVRGDCGTLVVHQYGVVEVSGGGKSQALTRAGYGVCAPSGGAVSDPFPVPPETIAAMNAEMASRGAQKGGATKQPTDGEAVLSLGNDRPPTFNEALGLDALNAFWAGNALIQSKANAENQANLRNPGPARPTQGGAGSGGNGGSVAGTAGGPNVGTTGSGGGTAGGSGGGVSGGTGGNPCGGNCGVGLGGGGGNGTGNEGLGVGPR